MDAEPSIAQTTINDLPATFGPGSVLLDVRENDEWQRGHAAAARHIPMGEVAARLDEIDRSATLYVICKAGGRSAKVAQLLAHHGYEPINVNGGMLAWAEAVDPGMRRFGFNPFGRDVAEEVHADLLRLVAEGQIRPAIGKRVPMAEAGAALDAHEQRRSVGRTVVEVA